MATWTEVRAKSGLDPARVETFRQEMMAEVEAERIRERAAAQDQDEQ